MAAKKYHVVAPFICKDTGKQYAAGDAFNTVGVTKKRVGELASDANAAGYVLIAEVVKNPVDTGESSDEGNDGKGEGND